MQVSTLRAVPTFDSDWYDPTEVFFLHVKPDFQHGRLNFTELNTFQDYNTYFTLGGCVGFVLFFQQEISKRFGNETLKMIKK